MAVDTSINNDFEKELVENGYKWFTDNWKKSIRGFQKKVTDEKGVKYFLTGYHYNFSRQFPATNDNLDRYNFDVQFRKDDSEKNTSKTIDIHYSTDFIPNKYRNTTSLKEAEEFYEKIWQEMSFDYYEKY
jgi:hypothetical protein